MGTGKKLMANIGMLSRKRRLGCEKGEGGLSVVRTEGVCVWEEEGEKAWGKKGDSEADRKLQFLFERLFS